MGVHKVKLLAASGCLLVGLAILSWYSLNSSNLPWNEPPAPLQTEGTMPRASINADDERGHDTAYNTTRPAGSTPTGNSHDSTKRTAASTTVGAATDRRREPIAVLHNKAYPIRVYQPLALPNDPSASQWWTAQAALESSWDIPAGSHQTVLAIIDTGFALAHEEFTDRWYGNAGEAGEASAEAASVLNCTARGLAIHSSCNLIDDDGDGTIDDETWPATQQNPSRLNCSGQGKPLSKDCNRIDDDTNGFIDDYRGWDFANGDNTPQAGEINPSGDGTTHGTRVAGVAAATGNNAKGIAGADWYSKIMPLQALDDDAYGDTHGVGRAIIYAAQQGADVISISLGSELSDDYVREAIAIATQAGSLVVAASGNDGCDCIVYPANYPEVVAVGATAGNGLPAGFSSYGSNLDILAPGGGILTTSWNAGNGTTSYASNVSGTSFATPLVAGVLARMLSHRADAAPLQLIAALSENTQRLTLPTTSSRSDTLGYGSLNATASIQRLTGNSTLQQAYGFSPVSSGGHLSPSQPVEAITDLQARRCADNDIGSTPLYELSRSGNTFYTISPTERWRAQAAGYTSQTLADICLRQPGDNSLVLRQLDLRKELRNILNDR